jgi:rhodanese-related sulfurtransferase
VLDTDDFDDDCSNFTIIDVRSPEEYAANKLYGSAINIPLNEVADRIKDIPVNKPVVVHCSSGYCSAIGSSIIKRYQPLLQVFDWGAIDPNADCGK